MNTKGIRTITNIIAFSILALFIVYLIMEWNNIPNVVATHFGISGKADAFGDKGSLIVIPVIAVIVCIVLAIVECFPQVWNLPVKVTEENSERLISDGLIMIGVLKILIASLFTYIGICAMNGWEIAWPMFILLGFIVIDIIIGIIKMIKDR